jgi:hypothetical protein
MRGCERGKSLSLTPMLISRLIIFFQTYKKYYRFALRDAVKELKQTFGYVVYPGDLLGQGFDSDKVYLSNGLNSPTLQRLLCATDFDASYRGFCFVIFNAIWCAPGREATASELLVAAHRMDSRFPATFKETSRKGPLGSIPPVPELGMHFSELLARMTADSYIQKDTGRDAGAGTSVDPSTHKYKLGVRFFSETDKQQLVHSYFRILGQPADEHVLQEIREEVMKDFELVEGEGDNEMEYEEGGKRQRVTLTSSTSSSIVPVVGDRSSSSSSSAVAGGGRQGPSSSSVAVEQAINTQKRSSSRR